MPRTDLYLKVQVDHDAIDRPERLADEICRRILKIHGVRSAEMTNWISQAAQDHEDSPDR
jgi:hypothetical protein